MQSYRTPGGVRPTVQDQIRSPEFYAETLSWDFDEVWEWNDGLNRPTLQGAPEPD